MESTQDISCSLMVQKSQFLLSGGIPAGSDTFLTTTALVKAWREDTILQVDYKVMFAEHPLTTIFWKSYIAWIQFNFKKPGFILRLEVTQQCSDSLQESFRNIKPFSLKLNPLNISTKILLIQISTHKKKPWSYFSCHCGAKTKGELALTQKGEKAPSTWPAISATLLTITQTC